MPKEYIEREATIRALQPTHAPAINEVLASVIRRVPAADVVEVVRCRECIHWSDKWEAASITGAHYCRRMGLFKLPSYYCADGKREDGGQDE